MTKPLAGHTNSYHTYSHDEALQGIAAGRIRIHARRSVAGCAETRTRQAFVFALSRILTQ